MSEQIIVAQNLKFASQAQICWLNRLLMTSSKTPELGAFPFSKKATFVCVQTCPRALLGQQILLVPNCHLLR